MTSNRAFLALLLIAVLVSVASPAAAQYMYLDANGNGVHDPGDRLAPNGSPTNVDLWVVTDHNRDGSPVTCPQDPSAPMTLISYVVNLAAGGGTVSYSGFTNHFGTVGFAEINPGDGIRYKNGFGSPFPAAAGTYRVCTLTITGLSGTPHVDIVDLVQGSTEYTSFGSTCFGNDFDNTLKLIGPHGGTDWSDVDGLGIATIDEGTPVIDPIGNKTVSEGSCLTFTATATAAHGGALVFTLDPGAPSGASITGAGQFTWCPTEAQGPAVYSVTVRVTEDGTPTTTDAETFQVTAAEVNQAPALAPISNKTIMAGNTLSFTATATDPDLPANGLFFSLDPGAPAGATVTAGGLFSWPVPINQVAGVMITVRVTDQGGLSDTKSFFVTVLINENGPPVVNNPGDMTVNEGSCLNFTATAISAGGGTLTFSLGAGAPAGASITGGGQFNWCPTEAQGPGSYPITVNCSEGAQTGSTTFTVTVREVNLAPVLNPIGNKTGPLGVLLTFTATATDADLPANNVTFSLDPGAPAGATIGAATGVFSWTPSSSGTFPVTIRVTDNGTLPLSDSETISITTCLGCGISPPTLAAIGNKTVNELALLSFTATATDPDIPPQTLTFSLGAGAPAGSAITAGGAFSWIPTEAQGPGVYPITVIVTDNGAGNLSDSETIQVTVNEVNLAPVLASIGTKVTCPGHTLTFTASATDADIPVNTLTCSMDPGGPPGATFNPTTCTFSWTPSSSGTFVATIRVTDNGTPPLSDSEVVTIVVGLSPEACGFPPVLQAIADMTVNEGSVGTQTIFGSDPDGQPLQFGKVSGPFWVIVQTVTPATGLVTASPDLSTAGTSNPVTAFVSDGALSDQKSFVVHVTGSCHPPVAIAGGPYAGVTWFPIEFNGTASSDPDGDIQSYGWSFGDGLTAGGATVSHSYNQPGTYLVQLVVSDACGLSDTDQTTVTISDCYSTNAFAVGGNKQISLLNGKPAWCVQLEAFGGLFDVVTIDPSSLVMRSMGTGTVGEIHAITDKTSVKADRNGNGYPEFEACFRKEDLRLLFSEIQGTQQVQVSFEGNLTGGARTCATLQITVKGGGGTLAATISPNPLNPSAVLTFHTEEHGPLLVQLFDVRGRLLRTLREEREAATGYHDVRIDGTSADGSRLASGVYYVRIRAGGVEERKAITILK
jgi:hypothetical protein